MAQPVIQTSFSSGEWSPGLNARVDLKQYHAGAALLRNFFVDYRGGATKAPGTKYILQTKSSSTVRLIPFQASFTVNYVLEFGEGYVRFFNNGAPVLEAAKTISGATKASPCVLEITGHGYSVGDWVYISDVGGMTQLNGNYYIVRGVPDANHISLNDLAGNAVDSSAYGTYTTGGSAQRIYTITSPYTAADLAQIKYAQDVNVMVLCHPNYSPYTLTLVTATNWTLTAITIGPTISAPTGQSVASSLNAGSFNYAYVITAVDINGQESGPSAFAPMNNVQSFSAEAGTNTVTWSAVTNAVSYNVYRSTEREVSAVPAGTMLGWIGNCTSTTFIDSGFVPDFSINYPIVRNPFSGSGVQSVAVTGQGIYSQGVSVPGVIFSGGSGSGAAAIAYAQMQPSSVSMVATGTNYRAGDIVTFPNGVRIQVTGVLGFPFGPILTWNLIDVGVLVPSGTGLNNNPTGQVSTTGGGSGATLSYSYGIVSIILTSPGIGYLTPPTVSFTSGGATATATLGAAGTGNPTVPGFFQQRLVLAGPVANPRQFNMSQPGTYFNFNVTDPVQPDNAFQGFLVSGQLNTIQSMVSQPQGLVVLSDQGAWLINGGSPGSGVDAINAVANAQVFSGAAGPQPLVCGEDVLYVQSKNSIVRNTSFNWQKQVYTGADITIFSSHLFYGYQITNWCWAEEPFKVVWAIRSDGILLCCTFIKDQELIAWCHRDTSGLFTSIVSIVEQVALGSVNAVYVVTQRIINGNTVQYIERFMEQWYPNGATDAWQVDCGLQYNGAAVTTFTGATHLAMADITGLATDDTGNVTVFTDTVDAVGGFSIAAPPAPATGYTRVTAGLAQPPAQLKTLGIDTGDPTIQGKMKQLPQVTVRVRDTLGLEIGTDFDNLVDMDDLIIGNVGKDTNEIVTADMVTGDALQALDPKWQVPGQYCIQSSDPWPATILGLIPQIAVGDTAR